MEFYNETFYLCCSPRFRIMLYEFINSGQKYLQGAMYFVSANKCSNSSEMYVIRLPLPMQNKNDENRKNEDNKGK